MREAVYQKSHRDHACVFCSIEDESVCGHHVRIKGLCGTGMKPHDIYAIPVCWVDHGHCHSQLHSMDQQKEKLLQYWLERLIEAYGEKEAWERMGRAVSCELIR